MLKGKIKAIIWALLIPLFLVLDAIITLFEHDWHMRQHWTNIMCFWHGGDSTSDYKVFDKQGNQLYPKL